MANPRTDQWQATHAAILEAARDEFGARGYARANTVDIATTASVTERTLFRHFPTKPALFEEAVITPFHDYIEGYVQRWRTHEPGTLEPHEATRQFYAELLDLLDRDRRLVVALASAQAFEDADGTRFPSLPHALARQISGLEPVMAAEAAARDYALDPGVLMRMMFGLVIAVSVHGDWLFGPDARPARERLLDQMTAFTNHGLRGR